MLVRNHRFVKCKLYGNLKYNVQDISLIKNSTIALKLMTPKLD